MAAHSQTLTSLYEWSTTPTLIDVEGAQSTTTQDCLAANDPATESVKHMSRDEAPRDGDASVSLNAGHKDALFHLAQTLLYAGHNEDASSLLQLSTRLFAADERAQACLALAQFAAGRVEQAASTLPELISHCDDRGDDPGNDLRNDSGDDLGGVENQRLRVFYCTVSALVHSKSGAYRSSQGSSQGSSQESL